MPYTNGRSDWTRFGNAFVNNPLCCPSRATILSGQYSHHHHVEENDLGNRFDASSTVATWLNSAGYRTGLVGKYLNGYPFGRALYKPPGWDSWYSFTSEPQYYNYSLYENSVKRSYGSEVSAYSTDVLTSKAVSFIKSSSNDPFFLYYAPKTPHNPFDIANASASERPDVRRGRIEFLGPAELRRSRCHGQAPLGAEAAASHEDDRANAPTAAVRDAPVLGRWRPLHLCGSFVERRPWQHRRHLHDRQRLCERRSPRHHEAVRIRGMHLDPAAHPVPVRAAPIRRVDRQQRGHRSHHRRARRRHPYPSTGRIQPGATSPGREPAARVAERPRRLAASTTSASGPAQTHPEYLSTGASGPRTSSTSSCRPANESSTT